MAEPTLEATKHNIINTSTASLTPWWAGCSVLCCSLTRWWCASWLLLLRVRKHAGASALRLGAWGPHMLQLPRAC
eukprot:1267815-Alexandrium_andersonii.AAC.1